MKATYAFILAVFMMISAVIYGDDGPGVPETFEAPMLALKVLGESGTDECRYCVEHMHKQAFSILDRYFTPERVFDFTAESSLLKNEECKDGELMPSQYKKRETAKSKENVPFEFPLIIFYFHTDRHHHAGIDRTLYSSTEVDEVYGKKGKNEGKRFKGRIKIIPYPYGDGATFIFNKNRNIVQVHCVIEKLEKLP